MAKIPKSELGNPSTFGLWESVKKKAVEQIATVLVLGGAGLVGLAATSTWAALKSWTVIELPAGVVMASLNPCDQIPGGWSLFEDAGGRFIIGAGAHKKNEFVDKIYAVFTDEHKPPPTGFTASTGGEEMHKLTVPEMPSHDHIFVGDNVARGQWSGKPAVDLSVGGEGSNIHPQFTPTGKILPTGDGGAHNNIPPYIALYYCRKN